MRVPETHQVTAMSASQGSCRSPPTHTPSCVSLPIKSQTHSLVCCDRNPTLLLQTVPCWSLINHGTLTVHTPGWKGTTSGWRRAKPTTGTQEGGKQGMSARPQGKHAEVSATVPAMCHRGHRLLHGRTVPSSYAGSAGGRRPCVCSTVCRMAPMPAHASSAGGRRPHMLPQAK